MLNIDCFGTNYIGIRFGCDTTAPTSGLYIDDLPGISLKLAAKLADDETKMGETLIRQLEGQAIREVWNDVRAKLASGLQVNATIETRQIGLHRTDTTVTYLPVQAANVGIKIEKSDYDPYTNIRVNYVDIKANSTVVGKTLTITDGCVSQDYTFDISAGCPLRIYTNYTAFGGPVFITVNAFDLELEDMTLVGGCACVESCRCSEYGCFNVIGWDGTNETGQANGMAANISCVCDESALVCGLQDDLCMAVQMKLGILLLEEQLATKRCNFFVLNSQEAALRQLTQWLGGINMEDGIEIRSKYWRLIGQTAAKIQEGFKSSGSKCIACAGLTAIETIP